MAILESTKLREIYLKLDFATGGLGEIKDILFQPANVTDPKRIEYPVDIGSGGVIINQPFSWMFVRNLVNRDLIFSVESDPGDLITIVAAGGHGMVSVGKNASLALKTRVQKRLRMFLSGYGSVEVVLHA